MCLALDIHAFIFNLYFVIDTLALYLFIKLSFYYKLKLLSEDVEDLVLASH